MALEGIELIFAKVVQSEHQAATWTGIRELAGHAHDDIIAAFFHDLGIDGSNQLGRHHAAHRRAGQVQAAHIRGVKGGRVSSPRASCSISLRSVTAAAAISLRMGAIAAAPPSASAAC